MKSEILENSNLQTTEISPNIDVRTNGNVYQSVSAFKNLTDKIGNCFALNTETIAKTRTVSVTEHGMENCNSFLSKVEQFFSNLAHNIATLWNGSAKADATITTIAQTVQSFYDQNLTRITPDLCGKILREEGFERLAELVSTCNTYASYLKTDNGYCPQDFSNSGAQLCTIAALLKSSLSQYCTQSLKSIEKSLLTTLQNNTVDMKIFDQLKPFDQIFTPKNEHFFDGWDSLKRIRTKYNQLNSVKNIFKELGILKNSDYSSKEFFGNFDKIKSNLQDIDGTIEKQLHTRLEQIVIDKMKKDQEGLEKFILHECINPYSKGTYKEQFKSLKKLLDTYNPSSLIPNKPLKTYLDDLNTGLDVLSQINTLHSSLKNVSRYHTSQEKASIDGLSSNVTTLKTLADEKINQIEADLKKIDETINKCVDATIKKALANNLEGAKSELKILKDEYSDMPNRIKVDQKLSQFEKQIIDQIRKGTYTVSEETANAFKKLLQDHPKLEFFSSGSGAKWKPLQKRYNDLHRVLNSVMLAFNNLKNFGNGNEPIEKLPDDVCRDLNLINGDLCQLTGGRLLDPLKKAFNELILSCREKKLHKNLKTFETKVASLVNHIKENLVNADNEDKLTKTKVKFVIYAAKNIEMNDLIKKLESTVETIGKQLKLPHDDIERLVKEYRGKAQEIVAKYSANL